MYSTRDEAVAEGKVLFATDDEPGHNSFSTFHVEQVRQARMSDFFKMSNLLSDLRENMAQMCGDDSVMDVREVPPGGLSNEGPKVFHNPQLELALASTLDDYAEFVGLDLSGLLIVEGRYEVQPEA